MICSSISSWGVSRFKSLFSCCWRNIPCGPVFFQSPTSFALGQFSQTLSPIFFEDQVFYCKQSFQLGKYCEPQKGKKTWRLEGKHLNTEKLKTKPVIWKKITSNWMQVNLQTGSYIRVRSLDTTLSHRPFWSTVPLVKLTDTQQVEKNVRKSWRLSLDQKNRFWRTASQKANMKLRKVRDPSIFFFWEVFCPPPFQKKKEFGHVLDTSGICPGCPGWLFMGYLRLSVGQNLRFPANQTSCGVGTNPSRRPVRSGTGPDGPRTFQPCVLLCFIKQILGNQCRVPGFLSSRASQERTYPRLKIADAPPHSNLP